MVKIENNSYMLEIRCYVAFLSVLGTFSQKVVEAWFICNETCHTKLICISYYVEMVRI